MRHYRFGGEYDLTSFNLIYMRDEGEARQSIREQNITNTFKDFKIKLAKIDTFKQKNPNANDFTGKKMPFNQ